MSDTPANWYPDPDDPTQLRYWDGTAWTDQRSPTAVGPSAQPEPAANYTVKKAMPLKRKIGIGAAVVLGLGIVGAVTSPKDEPDAGAPTTTEKERTTTSAAEEKEEEAEEAPPETTSAPVTEPPTTETTTPPPPPTTAADPFAGETINQQNARSKASDYLDYTAFSRSGLIDQLVYEGFTQADATYAVDAITVDWNAQAAAKAASYLEYTSFSRSGLVDQLVYEGFTQAQAEYGASTTGLS